MGNLINVDFSDLSPQNETDGHWTRHLTEGCVLLDYVGRFVKARCMAFQRGSYFLFLTPPGRPVLLYLTKTH